MKRTISLRQVAYSVLAVAVAGCMLPSCSSDAPDLPGNGDEPVHGDSQTTQITLTKSGESFVENANGLSFLIFNSALEDMDESANMCLSPFSILGNLAILSNGVSDETRGNMLEMFGIKSGSGEKQQDLNDYYAELLSKLPAVDGNVTLNFSNSLWCNPDFKVKDAFAEVLAHKYLGEVVYEAADGESGMAKINSWIGSHTNGMIPNFLEEPLLHPVALINTLYFAGDWKENFDPGKSAVAPFRNSDGTESAVDFMNTTMALEVARNENFVAVDVPFGNESYVMTFVLPENEVSDRKFSYADWNDVKAKSETGIVGLSIPKFKTDIKIDAKDVIDRVFPGNLNSTVFSDIFVGEDLLLKKMLHGISLEIDEKGCEAAGTTVSTFEIAPGPGEEIEYPKIAFNRPFYYLLREETTNSILFIGKINKF